MGLKGLKGGEFRVQKFRRCVSRISGLEFASSVFLGTRG